MSHSKQIYRSVLAVCLKHLNSEDLRDSSVPCALLNWRVIAGQQQVATSVRHLEGYKKRDRHVGQDDPLSQIWW